MSDTPSPLPESIKPKLSLAPKAPAAADGSPAPAPAPTLSAPPPTLGASNSNATPAGLAASSGAPRAALKLQGNVHPANPDKFADAKFNSPIPASADDAPSPAIVALSALAAVAAISFAVLLFLKNQ